MVSLVSQYAHSVFKVSTWYNNCDRNLWPNYEGPPWSLHESWCWSYVETSESKILPIPNFRDWIFVKWICGCKFRIETYSYLRRACPENSNSHVLTCFYIEVSTYTLILDEVSQLNSWKAEWSEWILFIVLQINRRRACSQFCDIWFVFWHVASSTCHC